MEFLTAQIDRHPEQAATFRALGDDFQNRLWHQLAQKLAALAKQPFFQQDRHLVTLLEDFVYKFDNKLRPLDLCLFTMAVTDSLVTGKTKDFARALQIVDRTAKTVAADAEGAVYARLHRTLLNVWNGKTDEAKAELDECRKTIDGQNELMDRVVFAAFHRAALEYHKVCGPASSFYEHALAFLAYTPSEDLSAERQLQLASDVGIAALLGDNVYNFGELVQHPVLKTLEGSPTEWVARLLRAFNAGDIAGFNRLSEEKGGSAPIVSANKPFLSQKIRVMALIEMVFQRPSADRTLTFEEIAKTCDLPLDQVELLLMKAFSLKVMRGKIDQVRGRVRVSWVQPRVLDTTQIASLRDRLRDWAKRVGDTASFVEQNGADLFPADR